MKFISTLAAVALPLSSSLTIVETATTVPSLSTLVAVLTTEAYKPVLDFLVACDPCTVFAPTNDAFTATGIDPAVTDITTVLQYHVLSGANVTSSDLPEGTSPTEMANMKYLNVVKTGDVVTLGFGIPGAADATSTVTTADVACSNGVVHIIDTVLIAAAPSAVAGAAGLTELAEALTKADLVTTVDAIGQTIFAPTNDALTAASWETLDTATLDAVLKLHVVGDAILPASMIPTGVTTVGSAGGNITVIKNSDGVSINGASVVTADVITNVGVVHVIDGVILPSWTPTILETAQIAGLTSLAGLIIDNEDYADIQAVLEGEGPFTVFAPTNDAFDAAGLDPAMVEAVKKALTYHVIAGAAVMSTDLVDGYQFPTTVEGQMISVYKDDTGVTINYGVDTIKASVVMADVVCSNGVVHVIDKVLMAPGLVSETAVASGVLGELVKALTKADLVATVDGLANVTIFAPVDKALMDANWETLDVATLSQVLTYHVFAGGVVKSTDLMAGDTVVATVNGQNITISKGADGTVMVNEATVVVANVLTSSGVVHVIDGVLMPTIEAPTPAADSPTAAGMTPTPEASSAMRAVPLFVVALAFVLA